MKPLKELLESPKFKLGKLCRYGHDHTGSGQTFRFVGNSTCITCAEIRRKEWTQSERGKASLKAAKAKRKEAAKIQSAEYRTRNKERILEYNREYRQKNREWYLEYYRQYNGRKHAALLEATPSWANKDAIEQIYNICRRLSATTGQRYEVDHIVPLLSTSVCGLHIESNLQILPAIENRAKGNRWWSGQLQA